MKKSEVATIPTSKIKTLDSNNGSGSAGTVRKKLNTGAVGSNKILIRKSNSTTGPKQSQAPSYPV